MNVQPNQLDTSAWRRTAAEAQQHNEARTISNRPIQAFGNNSSPANDGYCERAKATLESEMRRSSGSGSGFDVQFERALRLKSPD